MSKSKLRPLSTEETTMARRIFGATIDYQKVMIAARRIKPFQPKSGGLCTGNTINISGPAYQENYGCLKHSSLEAFYIHEMTHIWQFQRSPGYFGKKLAKELMLHHFNYMAKAYRYTLDEGKNFDDYGLEQQACIIQDYYALRYNQGKGISGQCKTNVTGMEFLNWAEKLLAQHFPAIQKSQDNNQAPKPHKPR